MRFASTDIIMLTNTCLYNEGILGRIFLLLQKLLHLYSCILFLTLKLYAKIWKENYPIYTKIRRLLCPHQLYTI